MAIQAAPARREVLTADRTYYFRKADGNPGNRGFRPNWTDALDSWESCIEKAAALDFNGHTVTIQHADDAPQTFTNMVVVPTMMANGGMLILSGSETPGITTFYNSTAECLWIDNPMCKVLVQNMAVGGMGSANIYLLWAGNLFIGNNMIFNAAGNAHIYVHDSQGMCSILNSDYKIAYGGNYHIFVNAGMCFLENTHITFDLTAGTPNFAGAFVGAFNNGMIQSVLCTFTNTCTGPRYIADMNGVINTYGATLPYFPGNAAGSTTRGGQYA